MGELHFWVLWLHNKVRIMWDSRPRCPVGPRPAMPARLRGIPMKLNQQKVEEAVLAVLWLTLHNEVEAWKTIDWDTMDRLHQKGFISDPTHRAKSVVFTEEGLAEAERVAKRLMV
jgi:hypothetical protein